jgi:transcriptional regulator with XRE-family HTH domain
MNAKQEFSERLRQAMRDAGYEPRPTVLERGFNTRYHGKSITLQAASSWLNGKSIPEQDKLQALADWLGVEPHVLRFGSPPTLNLQEQKASLQAITGSMERETLEIFATLSAGQKKVVRAIIMELAKAGAGKPTQKTLKKT